MLKEDRLDLLERRTAVLNERLQRLEGWIDSGYVVTRQSAAPTRVIDRELVREPKPAPVARPRPVERREAPAPKAVRVPPPRPAADPRPRQQRPEVNVEDLLGGRVLAWLGGIAVLVGIVFFFALAISHGWIGPAARTLIAGSGALALLGAGVWLHGRKGRTDASLAAVSTAIAGLFATVTVAAQVYDLVPSFVGLVLAAAVGGLATTLALRWESRGIAALGIGGALLAPLLVGAPSSTSSILFLLVAGAAASGVLLWQRWDWLAFGAFAITTPQWIGWLLDGKPSAGTALLVLAAFGALNVASAIGFELRVQTDQLRASSAYLLALNALVLGTVGWFWLNGNGHHAMGELWLVGLAIVHVGVGLAERRVRNISHEIGLTSLTLGVALADVAYGLIVSGPALAVGWAAGAVGFAMIKKRSREGSTDAMLAQVGLGVHIGLALIRALLADAPPSALTGDETGILSAAVALSALAAACFVSARVAEEGNPQFRVALDAIGLGALAYLTAIALDGPAVPLAWAAEAATLSQIGKRSDDRVAKVGALAFIALAGIHATVIEAPPGALIHGVDHLAAAVAALLALAAACFVSARVPEERDPRFRIAFDVIGLGALAYLTPIALDGILVPLAWAFQAGALAEIGKRSNDRVAKVGALAFIALAGIHATVIEAPPRALVYGVDHLAAVAGVLIVVGAITLRLAQLGTAMNDKQRIALWASGALMILFAASIAIVSGFQPGTSGAELSIFDIGTRQQGQVLLSAMWALVGVTVLLVGLRRDVRGVRTGALALLLVAVGKVFLYDLATLTSVYRVVSFVGLGLLLLAGAFAWQRMRPRPLPDLREAPRAVR
jgi:uncharacterized membrane protein